ncbi:hypothetical protein ACS0TY_000361 [Phlomoides rotata]
MPKFNVSQKRRRAAIATWKRQVHGESSGKLHQKIQPKSISGKRQRKLLKKWRRDQKEAVEKGLITMEDVEMAIADETAQDAKKPAVKFPMKKSVVVKQLKKGKNKKKSKKPAGETSNDTMVE